MLLLPEKTTTRRKARVSKYLHWVSELLAKFKKTRKLMNERSQVGLLLFLMRIICFRYFICQALCYRQSEDK